MTTLLNAATFVLVLRQLQFQFDPQRFIQYGVSVEDVIGTSRQATGVRGGRFRRISQPTNRVANGRSVRHTGSTCGDVVHVQDAQAPMKGKPGVSLIIEATYGANTLEVTRGIDEALADLPPSIEAQALVCGVFASGITGGNLSLGSLVGFVTLFGITLRNSIKIVSHYEHL